jgi:hypothetical protein
MENGLLGFMEMFIVFAFVLGWGVLELVSMRLDRKRAAEQQKTDAEEKTPGRS